MNIDKIRLAILEARAAGGEQPEFLLLSADEFADVKSDPAILQHATFRTGGMVDELFGLPIVIAGSAEHVLLQQRKRPGLRPNDQVQP